MQVWRDFDEVPDDWPSSVLTIGVFDGVHRGHRELIRTTVEQAKIAGMPSVVVTFWPNPIEVVGHGDPPRRLSTLTQRLELLEGLNVNAVMVLPFSPEFAAKTAAEFASDVLAGCLHAGIVVVGEDFRFGNKARGTVTLLTELGEDLGFTVEPVHLLTESVGQPVSSTLIRESIAQGEVAAGARNLVRPHRVEGTVVRGDGRGRELGFPTANLDVTAHAAIPADGVYAGQLILDPYGQTRRAFPAAISIGTNPTFEGNERSVEAFAYDAGDLSIYDQHVAFDFVAHIRGQEKFANTDDLVSAVERDVDSARAVLGG